MLQNPRVGPTTSTTRTRIPPSPSLLPVQTSPQPHREVLAYPIQVLRRRLGKVEQLVHVRGHRGGILGVGREDAVHQPFVARLAAAVAPATSHSELYPQSRKVN